MSADLLSHVLAAWTDDINGSLTARTMPGLIMTNGHGPMISEPNREFSMIFNDIIEKMRNSMVFKPWKNIK